jgi:hypothetical protein
MSFNMDSAPVSKFQRFIIPVMPFLNIMRHYNLTNLSENSHDLTP